MIRCTYVPCTRQQREVFVSCLMDEHTKSHPCHAFGKINDGRDSVNLFPLDVLLESYMRLRTLQRISS